MSFEVRQMTARDISAVADIYTAHVEREPDDGFQERLTELLERTDEGVALVAEDQTGAIVGYLAGEIRVFEFGSDPAGWIFALAVAPSSSRDGVGGRLREAAVRRFSELGVSSVRTMVKRDDIGVLRFFRDGGFRAGPYVELELDVPEQERKR